MAVVSPFQGHAENGLVWPWNDPGGGGAFAAPPFFEPGFVKSNGFELLGVHDVRRLADRSPIEQIGTR